MYDVVFISYEEINAEEHFNLLINKLGRGTRLKRVHGVRGIHAAHKIAAKTVDTEMFYVVDGDAMVVDEFSFNYRVPEDQKQDVHVFRAKNPLNDLVYGYGAVKLFPTEVVAAIDLNNIKTDMSSSINVNAYRVVNQLSNITAFNTDPYNTWRSAFRECAKLSSKIIDNQKDDETESRLEAWCTLGFDKPFGMWALKGAKAGKLFGKLYASQPEKLMYINNMDWLKTKFEEARI